MNFRVLNYSLHIIEYFLHEKNGHTRIHSLDLMSDTTFFDNSLRQICSSNDLNDRVKS